MFARPLPRLTSPPRLRRALRTVAAVIGLTASLGLAQQHAAEEYQLKAAFVFHFPRFVEWPAHALDGRATLDVCVIKPNPFGRTLEDLIEGETLNGLSLAVRQVTPEAAVEKTCPVLFIPAAASARPTILKRVADQPVLTVGDAPDFLDQGGIIELRVVESKVRFDVNLTAARRAGLTLSSQLLRLAAAVRGGGRP